MFAPPPQLNLLVIRSKDIDRAATLYTGLLGLLMTKHSHNGGVEHYTSNVDGFIFEIYPLLEGQIPTTNTRIGFLIDTVDEYISDLVASGIEIVKEPYDSEWGRRAIIKDWDGHTIELLKVK